MLRPNRLRVLSWTLMAGVALSALTYGAVAEQGPQTDGERAAALAATIACPQCTGQPVSDSNAAIAEIIRTEIKVHVDSGLTDAQIRQIYVDRYGEWVDLNPSRSGLTGAVWVLPFLVIGAATGALALAFARWRKPQSEQRSTTEDREIIAVALNGPEPGPATIRESDL